MKNNFLIPLRLTFVSLLFFCGFYTLIIWSFAQIVPSKGAGLVKQIDGESYYINVGQAFTEDRYFWSRPSAVDYDASGSGGSNYGPSNSDHLNEVEKHVEHFLQKNPDVSREDIPADLVTASGSGLDPHISVAAASVQIKRIAKTRGISEFTLLQLIQEHTESPLFGFLGPERINVLRLNIELDRLSKLNK